MKKVVALIVLTAVIFATMEVALKTAGAQLDSLQLTFLRFLLGGLVLLPPSMIECRKSGYRMNARDLGWVTLVGTMGIPVSMLSYQIGVMHCNAATAAPLICTNPLFTMLIAHFLLGQKMNRRKWVAFCIGLVAILLMIRPWDVQPGNTPFGIAILIFAAVTFGAYSVMGKRSIARIGTFTQTSVSFITGSLILLVIMILTGHSATAGISQNLGVIIYCGIVVTGIGYLTYFLAIRYSDAVTGSITFFIKPAIAPVFAILILHETIYWNTVAGIILLITASFLTITGSASGNTAGKES
ncbi:MAG: DMT family transporter [Lachnospiraceae bacterium]|nr:DMT family transporter [Lachnospiraceae bacterium]